MRPLLLSVVLLLCPPMPAIAAASHSDRADANYWRGYLSDSSDLMLTPLIWQPAQSRKVFYVVALTGLTYSADAGLREEIGTRRGKTRDDLARVGDYLGDGLYLLPGLAGAYAYGHFRDDARARRTALYGTESFVISGVFVTVAKHLLGRHRPYTGDGKDAWDGPRGPDSDKASFPSGHTTSAFAVATTVATEYADTPGVAPLAYSLATLTALSRVYANKHWTSDTVMGGAIGYFTAKSIVGYHAGDGQRARLQPEIGERFAGVTLRVPF